MSEKSSENHQQLIVVGCREVLNTELRVGSPRQFAQENGIKMLLCEAGEAPRFDDMAIRPGVRRVFR